MQIQSNNKAEVIMRVLEAHSDPIYLNDEEIAAYSHVSREVVLETIPLLLADGVIEEFMFTRKHWRITEAGKMCVAASAKLAEQEHMTPTQLPESSRTPERTISLLKDMSGTTFTPKTSLQFVACAVHNKSMSVEDALRWMAAGGSSVICNWGEDSNTWECSWITGDIRFTGNQPELRMAILESLNKCFEGLWQP